MWYVWVLAILLVMYFYSTSDTIPVMYYCCYCLSQLSYDFDVLLFHSMMYAPVHTQLYSCWFWLLSLTDCSMRLDTTCMGRKEGPVCDDVINATSEAAVWASIVVVYSSVVSVLALCLYMYCRVVASVVRVLNLYCSCWKSLLDWLTESRSRYSLVS
jgi:hypothetical protein